MDLRDASFVVARAAFVEALLKLSNRTHQTTNIAHVDGVCVRDGKETFLEEGCGTVGNHTITFHLSETETTIPGTTFDRLAGENLEGSTGTSVDLVVDHMA